MNDVRKTLKNYKIISLIKIIYKNNDKQLFVFLKKIQTFLNFIRKFTNLLHCIDSRTPLVCGTLMPLSTVFLYRIKTSWQESVDKTLLF
jgi:hypothetical protein